MPIFFDLLAGKVVQTGGDIQMTVNRMPGALSGRNRIDWSLQVEAVDGGIIRSSGQEQTTYWAPESGYQERETFIFSTNAPYKWSEGFTEGLFIRSRNGQVFSKVRLSFTINYKPEGFMGVSFQGVANTNGSRNWEGDPNTLIPQ